LRAVTATEEHFDWLWNAESGGVPLRMDPKLGLHRNVHDEGGDGVLESVGRKLRKRAERDGDRDDDGSDAALHARRNGADGILSDGRERKTRSRYLRPRR